MIAFCLSSVSLPLPVQRDVESQLTEAADLLNERPVEGRLSGRFEYRPPPGHHKHDARPLAILRIASRSSSMAERDHAPSKMRVAAAAVMLVGRTESAIRLLAEALTRSTGEADVLAAVHHSRDRELLSDFAAALLAQTSSSGNIDRLPLAFESVDRACKLGPTPEALWNRALAIEYLHFQTLAVQAWRTVANIDRGSPWADEAKWRRADAERRGADKPPASEEMYFQGELIRQVASIARGRANAIDGTAVRLPSLEDVEESGRRRAAASGDFLVKDTAEGLKLLMASASPTPCRHLLAGLDSFVRGREAFENDQAAQALRAFRQAEADLSAARSPLALLAEDQRIRCECWQHNSACLDHLRALRKKVEAFGRYPWLVARIVYAQGQTFYRQGKIYEAATLLRSAQAGLRQTNDEAGVAMMDSLLANVLAVAGERDQALTHYLAGLRLPAPLIGDRRRRQLGDLTIFLLRHGYTATTELVLDELDRWPATAEGKVKAATLRGVIHARHGDPAAAAVDFRRAHELVKLVSDKTVRADAANSLVVAEAGARAYSPEKVLPEIEAAIVRHEEFDDSVLMPQLLVERGTLLEAHRDLNGAKRDYLRAMTLMERRAPRVDQMLMGFGIDSQIDSPFDRAIRVMLDRGELTEALAASDRATALRISALYGSSAGLRNPFRGTSDSADHETPATLQQLLDTHEVVVVEHLLRDELVSWIITKSDIHVVRSPVKAATLIAHAERFRQCVGTTGCSYKASREEISAYLIRGWIDRIPRDATLTIIPPAEFPNVPFSMLMTAEHEPLVQRNDIVTAPGVRAYIRACRADATRRRGGVPYFAAAPNPAGDREHLPLAASEVTLVSRIYRNGLADTATRRDQFLKHAASASIIHFAGHAEVNTEQPLRSALVFEGQDQELLYVEELEARSFAKVRLVVLSACETGVAPKPTMSIAHALLSQGVPSVIYTSWRVPDDAAREFAIEFHRAVAAGESRSGALRIATLKLLQKYPNRPECWAAFQISGAHGRLYERKAGGHR